MNDIDLAPYAAHLDLRHVDGKDYLRCMIRKRNLVLQPEEMVRQLLLLYLVQDRGFSPAHIQVEKSIKVNNLNKRFDIIVYDTSMSPFILIECKSHTLPIRQSGLDQIGRYNLSIQAPYILLTNGIHYICAAINQEKKNYTIVSHIPHK